MIEHTFRLSLATEEQSFILTRQGIIVKEEGQTVQKVCYAEIESVRLMDYGNTLDVKTFRCELKTAQGKLVLSNLHYVGLMKAEDRAETFRKFVLTLHQALNKCGKDVSYRVGSNLMRGFFGVMTFTLPILMVLAIIGLCIKGFSFKVVRFLALGAAAFGWSLYYFKTSKPESYNPETIPMQFLPDAI